MRDLEKGTLDGVWEPKPDQNGFQKEGVVRNWRQQIQTRQFSVEGQIKAANGEHVTWLLNADGLTHKKSPSEDFTC